MIGARTLNLLETTNEGAQVLVTSAIHGTRKLLTALMTYERSLPWLPGLPSGLTARTA